MTQAALDPRSAPWLAEARTQRLFELLNAAGEEAWFVGGAVRNALLGLEVDDIDMATTALPETVVSLMRGAGLQVVPTGIDHGTVTVMTGAKGIEITTLRRDVSTDGRRATVAFTARLEEDAQRRDFTLNALYADAHGRIIDPVGGLDDLAAGQVRFIGDAERRIAEDALRILRFFRFTTRFSRTGIDAMGLAACIRLRAMLKSLSRERVRQELMRLLGSDDPEAVVAAMMEGGVLCTVLPEALLDARLGRLIAREKQIADVSPERRLAALLPARAAVLDDIARRLRFSNAARQRFSAMAPDAQLTRLSIAANLYRLGRQRLGDQLLLHGGADFADRHAQAMAAAMPQFPLRGGDLIARGVDRGPKVTQVLQAIEREWLAAGCPASPAFDALVDQAVAAAI